jgi:hypothetical protein
MKWFAVQSVFRHGDHEPDAAKYEERVVMYRADTVERAIERAKTDNAAYLRANPEFSEVGHVSVFALNANADDLNGTEVWSCLHRGPSRSEDFWAGRYENYSLQD